MGDKRKSDRRIYSYSSVLILLFLAFDSVVSSTATSVKLSSSTLSARSGKLPECSTSVLILLFVGFDSVVSPISTSVTLSRSIPSSTARKLLEFSLAEKIRTGSVGNVHVYWLTVKHIGESSDVRLVSMPSTV